MSEPLAAFVEKRRAAWRELEALLAQPVRTLDEALRLEQLYRASASDLAVAQRRYPDTDVARLLNQLVAAAWRAIDAPVAGRLAALRTFYARTLPAMIQHLLPLTRFAAGLLCFGAVTGALTVALHPDGELLLVPADLRGWISRQELWTDGILGVETPGSMAMAIFLNNLRVAFFAALLGITFGLGTALITLYNGLFLGAVVAACFRGGLGWNILTFMSAHGPVELSLICLCAAAGLHVGRALVDPGERSRRAALAAHARLSLQVVLGLAPFVVAIGIVEGFVSPGGYFPSVLKVAVGLASGLGFWRWILREAR